jgi:hypothetical protein
MQPIAQTIQVRRGRNMGNMGMRGQFMPHRGHARVCLAMGREGAANAPMGKEQWKTNYEYTDCGDSGADGSPGGSLGALFALLRSDAQQLEPV